MAPRKPRLVQAEKPGDFDVDAFIQGFKRPEFVRNLYRRADLIPRLAELDELTTDLATRLAKLDAAGSDDAERSIDDVNPAVQIRERLTALTEEFNALAGEYEESAVAFTFRVPDGKNDRKAQRAAMVADGVWLDAIPEDDEVASDYFELGAIYSMSQTCTSHPMSVDKWNELRARVGEPAWLSLVDAWVDATKAGRPSAPFSQKPLPTPTTPVSSAG